MWKTVPNIKKAVVELGQRNYNEVIILIHEGGSNMLKLLVTMPVGAVKDSFLNEETKQLLEQHFDVSYNLMERNYTAEELAEAAKNCTILVTNGVQDGLPVTSSGFRMFFARPSRTKLVLTPCQSIIAFTFG